MAQAAIEPDQQVWLDESCDTCWEAYDESSWANRHTHHLPDCLQLSCVCDISTHAECCKECKKMWHMKIDRPDLTLETGPVTENVQARTVHDLLFHVERAVLNGSPKIQIAYMEEVAK